MLRPDLTYTDPSVVAYIEYLETELGHLKARRVEEAPAEDESLAPPFDPTEPPTTFQIATVSRNGLVKRTARHLYERQRRSGMGVFDLDTPENDPPALLCHADESEMLVLITNKSRAFRVKMDEIPALPVRSKGVSFTTIVPLQEDESPAALVPAARGVMLAVLSQTGYVRALPAHVVGQAMTPGIFLYRYVEFGPVAGACWTSGQGDLLVVSRRGVGIRFPEKALPVTGGLGIRLDDGDAAVAIEAVRPPEGQHIFLIGADGKGTLRDMAGFSANKAPGGGGKLAMKTDQLAGAVAANPADDLFVISRLGKIIRFKTNEVPLKDSVVQGVHCMSFRADECVAVISTR